MWARRSSRAWRLAVFADDLREGLSEQAAHGEKDEHSAVACSLSDRTCFWVSQFGVQYESICEFEESESARVR